MNHSNFFHPWIPHTFSVVFLASKAWPDTHVASYAIGNLMAKVAEYFLCNYGSLTSVWLATILVGSLHVDATLNIYFRLIINTFFYLAFSFSLYTYCTELVISRWTQMKIYWFIKVKYRYIVLLGSIVLYRLSKSVDFFSVGRIHFLFGFCCTK